MPVQRNGFISGQHTRTFTADATARPGWEVRGTITRAAETQGGQPPNVTVTAYAVLVDPSLVDVVDRAYSSGQRTRVIPPGEDTSDAAAEAAFYALADAIADELPQPAAVPPAP